VSGREASTSRTWVVRATDAKTVGAIVQSAGGDPRAIDEGRVFVGRRRARDASEAVQAGDLVTIAPAVAALGPGAVAILAHEADFVAVDKPAGLPTIPDHGGASHALITLAASAIGLAASRLHPTSRLDRDVSGVVVFALAPEASARFTRARAAHTYVRRYVALAASAPRAPEHEHEQGTWDAPIGRARDPRHRAPNGKEAADARTHFQVVARAGAPAMLALAPITGRTHQLRVHASHAGAPLLGDRVYGGPTRLSLASGRVVALDRVALHAARVTVPRASGEPLTILSPVPPALAALWLSLGGADTAWDIAVTCSLPER
jgi:23S rRNA pseudouridine1911/1915/1917 synthase